MSLHLEPERILPSSLAVALASVTRAADRASSDRATEMLIDAVGNNHAGTYLPEVLAAIPLAEVVLQTGSAWAQRAVLEALVDLCGSFEPETGCEVFEGAPLAVSLKESVQALSSSIKAIASSSSVAAASAAGLLEVL